MSDLKLTPTCYACPKCHASYSTAKQYGGLCGSCWQSLSPNRRAVLLGKEPVLKEIVTHRIVETPPRNRALSVLTWPWAALVTAAVAMLMYGKGR